MLTKKRISVLVMTVMLLSLLLVTTAFAVDDYTNYQFTFTAGSANGTPSDFGFSGNYKTKGSTKTYIEVRHTVPQNGAGFTNLIAADDRFAGYVGSKWMASNGIYYSTNGGCSINREYAPCGRGNTRYSEQFGLTSITITGQFRVH